MSTRRAEGVKSAWSRITPPVSLVVEPHDDTRELYVEHFQRLGWETHGAGDGAVGLSKALDRPPDLVLTELRLPRIDGPDFIEILKREPTTAVTAIVILTADVRKASLAQARRTGADAVLTKPVQFDALFASIEQLIRQRARIVANSDALMARVSRVLADANHALGRAGSLTRSMGRYSTTTPPEAPPPLACADCAMPLQYRHSYVGGVNRHRPEQWDYYLCPSGCGQFQYRQRTRRLRRVT